jgi:hypothetical protein
MSKLLTTVGLGLVLAITTAAAAPAQKPASKPSSQPGDQQVYCLKLERMTGSNVDRSGCRTKAEWRKLGIDLDNLDKE